MWAFVWPWRISDADFFGSPVKCLASTKQHITYPSFRIVFCEPEPGNKQQCWAPSCGGDWPEPSTQQPRDWRTWLGNCTRAQHTWRWNLLRAPPRRRLWCSQRPRARAAQRARRSACQGQSRSKLKLFPDEIQLFFRLFHLGLLQPGKRRVEVTWPGWERRRILWAGGHSPRQAPGGRRDRGWRRRPGRRPPSAGGPAPGQTGGQSRYKLPGPGTRPAPPPSQPPPRGPGPGGSEISPGGAAGRRWPSTSSILRAAEMTNVLSWSDAVLRHSDTTLIASQNYLQLNLNLLQRILRKKEVNAMNETRLILRPVKEMQSMIYHQAKVEKMCF